MTLHWCQFKTAVLLDDGALSDALVDDTIFENLTDDLLPEGWSFTETSISGAAGFVLIFDVIDLPKEEDLLKVETVLKKLNQTI